MIFPAAGDPTIRDALEPLLRHRRRQARRGGRDLYRQLDGAGGYRPGEGKLDFLARHGIAPGPVKPQRLPANLLLVGSAEEIPFDFQFQLGLQHAVGRLDLDDAETFHRYAERVVAADDDAPPITHPPTPCRTLLVAPRNPDDGVTERIVDRLAAPLAQFLRDHHGTDLEALLADAATKDRLVAALGRRPHLLFLAGHGLQVDSTDPHQRARQGAFLCQDWPGPRHRGPIPAAHTFSGDDVPEEAPRLVFHFGCFSAGTPALDGFRHLAASPKGGDGGNLAPRPFVADLPRRLLARGSLAVLGHVERTWGWSFLWPGAGAQHGIFESFFDELLAGASIGRAMTALRQRHGELASDLVLLLEARRRGRAVDADRLTGLWTATADARHYALLGDPAVKLFSPIP